MSDVGEASAGMVTMVSPDYSQHVHRYQCTRSYSYDYKCLSCKSGHSVLDPDSITILISDQFCPDTLPPNTDGTCTLIIRLHGLTMEDLCFFTLGQLNERGANWEGWKSYGVSELLIKAEEQGKKVFLAVLSGTDVVEGGPVSISNSQQTVFSQLHSRGLFLNELW